MTFDFAVALALIFLYAALDALYVIYTLEMTRLNPMRASIAAVFIYVLGALGVVSYTANNWYILSVAIGSFLGTYLVVFWERRKKERKK